MTRTRSWLKEGCGEGQEVAGETRWSEKLMLRASTGLIPSWENATSRGSKDLVGQRKKVLRCRRRQEKGPS